MSPRAACSAPMQGAARCAVTASVDTSPARPHACTSTASAGPCASHAGLIQRDPDDVRRRESVPSMERRSPPAPMSAGLPY